MRDGLVDLHIHSCNSSDGDFSPAQILKLASEKNFRAVSIADHDTVAAYPEALEIGKKYGVEVIPGIELTTMYKSREFHLLLPFVDWKSEKLHKILRTARNKRLEEAEARIDRLRSIGFAVHLQEVVDAAAPFPPLGVTIAQVVLATSQQQPFSLIRKYTQLKDKRTAPYAFYRDYFVEGMPAYVSRRNIQLGDVLSQVEETGGIPVLAHPGAPFQNVAGAELRELRGLGLEGLEVYTSYHDTRKTNYYKEQAALYDLVATAGSDFHGSIKPDIPFGLIRDGGYAMVSALRKRRKAA
jgi:3',5'-nucleoside bisphosphate phosphatase